MRSSCRLGILVILSSTVIFHIFLLLFKHRVYQVTTEDETVVPVNIATTNLPTTQSTFKNSGKVIIYAKYRTGSTFTSEFFFRHRDIAYIFEPLRTKQVSDVVKDGNPILRDMLDCKYSTNNTKRILKWWMDKVVFCQITGQSPGCIHGKPYSTHSAAQHCQAVTNKVVKVIRIEQVWELEEFFRENVKVVHVLRDPRGIAHSRRKIHRANEYWGQIVARTIEYCTGALADFLYIQRQYKKNPDLVRQLYHVVRYEDLAHHPQREMQRLYRFLDITPDKSLQEWVNLTEKHTESGKEKTGGYAYSTRRANPGYTSTAWREVIDWDTTTTVQRVCAEFMRVTGYNKMTTEKHLRNSSKELFLDIQTESLLETKILQGRNKYLGTTATNHQAQNQHQNG